MTCKELAETYGFTKLEVNRIIKRLGIPMRRGREGSTFSESELESIHEELMNINTLKGKNYKITLKGIIDKRYKKENQMKEPNEEFIEEDEELIEFEEDLMGDELYEDDDEDEDLGIDAEFYDEDELDELDDTNEDFYDDEEDDFEEEEE